MISRIIHKLLKRRHYWRHVTFDEIAEIYSSRALRMSAVSMTSILVSIFLYQNGYSVAFIAFYIASYFMLRAVFTIPLSFLIARIGPKHATFISNVMYAPALLFLALLPEYGIAMLVSFGVLQAMSVALYDTSHMVNYSKVKHPTHEGKELGYLHMIDKVVMGLSPVIGGVIALFFGPQATLVAAAGVFLFAAAPLLSTPEQMRTHQHITYRGLPWKKLWRGVVAQTGVGADFVVSGAFWSLFLAIAVFGVSDNTVYAEIGLLLAATIVVALVSSKLFGMFIDHRKAGDLLIVGTAANSLVHVARPFVTTPLGGLFVNISNEIAMTAYAMPFMKGICDQADSLPGYRIAYLAVMSMAACVGAALLSALIGLIALSFDEVISLQAGFMIAAIYCVLIAVHSFPALRRSR